MTSVERYAAALIRCNIVQAVRDGEICTLGRSNEDVRRSILEWICVVSKAHHSFSVQLDYRSTLHRAADRFVQEGEPSLAVVMYATAVEHWLNGMLEVGLKRRGEELHRAAERGSLVHKLTVRWAELFGIDFPENLQEKILQLAEARNSFVHYKWTSRSEGEDAEYRLSIEGVARSAPGLLAELDRLEDAVVFDGEIPRLEQILDDMHLHGVPNARVQSRA